jgi:hypothetical protein
LITDEDLPATFGLLVYVERILSCVARRVREWPACRGNLDCDALVIIFTFLSFYAQKNKEKVYVAWVVFWRSPLCVFRLARGVLCRLSSHDRLKYWLLLLYELTSTGGSAPYDPDTCHSSRPF